jgi:hypothetical protein
MTQPTYQFTEEEFNKAIDENTSVRVMKELSEKAGQRLYYILSTIAGMVGWEMVWCDFDNEGGNERSPGYWDASSYKEDIGFIAEFKKYKNADFDVYDFIPSEWLKIDFEPVVRKDFDAYLEEKNETLKAQKDKKERIKEIGTELKAIQEQIWNKLTEKERAFISFNSANAVYEYEEKIEKRKLKKKP